MASFYRADQVGGLLRPPELLQGREEYKEKCRSPEDLRRMEEQAVLKR